MARETVFSCEDIARAINPPRHQQKRSKDSIMRHYRSTTIGDFSQSKVEQSSGKKRSQTLF
jgi:hypothetical protein